MGVETDPADFLYPKADEDAEGLGQRTPGRELSPGSSEAGLLARARGEAQIKVIQHATKAATPSQIKPPQNRPSTAPRAEAIESGLRSSPDRERLEISSIMGRQTTRTTSGEHGQSGSFG